MALDGIRRAREKKTIVYDKEEFCLRAEDGHIAFLGNAYQEYCAAQKPCRAEVLQKYVRVWFTHQRETPESFEDAQPDVLPALNSRAYYELVPLRVLQENGKKLDVPYQVVGEHFGASLVYDMPESRTSIGQAQLDKWGVTFYEGMEVAREALSQLKHPFMGPAEGDGVYLSMAKDSYDASRILHLDLIRQFRVTGAPVAMIPNRETLIVTGAEDADGLKGMLALAKDAMQQPRYISGIALRLDGEEWSPWLPDVTHPLYWAFRALQAQSLGHDYSEQKEILDKLNEKAGKDVFVASFSGMSDKGTDRVFSYSVWTKDVPTFLPHTDRILLNKNGEQPVMVEWDRAVEVVGDLMKPLDMYPPRFEVAEFPTDKQLAAMGNMLE
jgi:hypothetical protein